MNDDILRYIKTKKAWVFKKAILENARHKRIAWLLQSYNRGIPCKIEDINENKAKIVVMNDEWKLRLSVWVPFIAVNVEHKLFKHSISLLLFLQKDIIGLTNFEVEIQKQEKEYLEDSKK